MADMYFERKYDDPEAGLLDGLDFLEYAQTARPHAIQYAFSMFAGDEDYHRRAKEKNLTVRKWIQKAYYKSDNPKGPWADVERDLISDACGVQPSDESEGVSEIDDADFSSYARELNIPSRTYIQHFAGDFRVIKPIEVVCERILDPDTNAIIVIAEARRLGLLVKGEGATIKESLVDLAELIADQANQFKATSPEKVVGYAEFVRQQIAKHLLIE